MRKIFALLLLACLTAADAGAQLLYKVSGNGLEKSSYIIGTHHLCNAGFASQVTGVRDALVATDQVYGELIVADAEKPDTVKMLSRMMYLPGGDTLRDVLSATQYKEVDAFLKRLMGVGLSSPQVMEKMGRMTPAALAVELQKVIYMTRHMGEYDPSSSLDKYFQAQAVKNNEPVGGLETVERQGRMMFDKPMKRQVEALMCLIHHEDEYADSMDELTDAYCSQDLDKLQKAVEKEYGSSCAMTAEEKKELIDDRNDAWVKVMPGIMKERPTFFAVGAAHLLGAKGVLQQLRDAGYTVEGVK